MKADKLEKTFVEIIAFIIMWNGAFHLPMFGDAAYSFDWHHMVYAALSALGGHVAGVLFDRLVQLRDQLSQLLGRRA